MHITRHYKRVKVTRLTVAIVAMTISLFFMPYFIKYEKTGNNIFDVYLNGTMVGTVNSEETANELLLAARKNVNSLSDELTFIDYELTFEGHEVDFCKVDDRGVIISNMESILKENVRDDIKKAYEVKINSYVVDLESEDDVLKMLQAPIDKYDDTGNFVVSLENTDNRELPVLSAVVETKEEIKASEESASKPRLTAGLDLEMDLLYETIEPDVELELDDYELGTVSMKFGDEIEIVEVYINPKDYSSLDAAIEEVTREEEQSNVYTVVSGDTLSAISMKVDVPMEDLIAMNSFLEDQNSTIRPDDEIVYSVPEPKLSVIRQEVMYYDETYDAPVEYEYRDDWYTSDVEVIQQPSAGYHEVVATVTFENDKSVSEEIIQENVIYEAVPKKVMKGTKIPPTFIKPIYGGRLSSTFGYRKAPTKGASTYHKGVDWSTPVGTAVYASSGGVVTRAGWASGYGYVVYIDHQDGRQTRYGHLSKVLVSAGQSVSQGQKIALSGNTGVSTGPHLHFEILINGTFVNPLKYVSQ